MQLIFARLGVKLVTRNTAQGRLGTIQYAMEFQSIYGDEIDILIWSSSMLSLFIYFLHLKLIIYTHYRLIC